MSNNKIYNLSHLFKKQLLEVDEEIFKRLNDNVPLLAKIGQSIELVLLIELDNQILVERLLSRGRSDDNEGVIRHRLEVYREKTAPLIEHYSHQGLLKIIQGDATIDVVANRIEAALN